MEEVVESAVESSITPAKEVSGLSISVQQKQRDKSLYDLDITVTGIVIDIPFTEKYQSVLRVSRNVCDRCCKYTGGYFEAIIQLRAKNRQPSDEEVNAAKEMVSKNIRSMQEGNRDAFISKIEEVKGGIDFYLSTQGSGSIIAKLLQSRFGGSHQVSAKIAGMKAGVDIYRVTHLVRMPEYRPGDVLKYKNKDYVVKNTNDRTASITSIQNLETFSISHTELDDSKIIFKKEDIQEAVVVYVASDTVQIIDPENSKAVDVPLPRGYKPGETVKIARSEGRNILIP
jgi:nonsense-mediated mRNA decay protein 3